MSLDFLVCRKVCFVRGTHFPATGAQTRVHRPIAIDGAGADGGAEGAGGVEPGPSNDHGRCGAWIDQH